MEIAVLFEDDIFNRKGAFRAKLERARNLASVNGWKVDIWCIQTHYTWIERLLLGKRSYEGISEQDLGKPKELCVDGVRIHMIWMDYSILDHFLFFKLRARPWFYPLFLKRLASSFKQYDLISAHSFEGGYLAREVFRRFDIPYCVTWHGSDIHTKPFKYPCIRPLTAGIMADAKKNFFVSRALMEVSESIGPGNKEVLYNGFDASFYRYSDDERVRLREKYDTFPAPVIGFVGSLERIKNVDLLPDIFMRVQELYKDAVQFWVIGDGRLRAGMEEAMKVPCRFFGNVAPHLMPELFNAMDMVVLPSKNEGLPLVLLEALGCGCNAVGSLVGGIPEVLEPQFCVPLGEDFVDRFAHSVADCLSMRPHQTAPSSMSWEEAAKRESEVYRSIGNRQVNYEG